MEEIKTRLYLLAAFFKGRATGSEVTDVEFGCLQFRKVLELITLASIAPNKEMKDGYLTKADFESVYIKCGAALHARNLALMMKRDFAWAIWSVP